MEKEIKIKRMGFLAKLADFLMVPIMYLVSGTLKETPQRGHRWNNQRLRREDIEYLDREKMVHCKGFPLSARHRFLLFHIPIFGGWRGYVVLEPTAEFSGKWHVGYSCYGITGVSIIEISGPVRMLVGKEDITFFGIDAQGNGQIAIKYCGTGKIGDGGVHSRKLLL